ENSCPVGFFCQFSAKRNQFQCCGQSGGCPERRAAYIAVDGNAQECLPGPDMCADGFECVLSITGNGKNICCSNEEECAENEKKINGTCVVQRMIGGLCNRDEECGGGSQCENNICRCPAGHRAVLGECHNTECTPNQISLNGRCYDRASIGEPCKSSLQ
ncbi:EB domain-containing protein, partial [Trichostrongylus colubriformis]